MSLGAGREGRGPDLFLSRVGDGARAQVPPATNSFLGGGRFAPADLEHAATRDRTGDLQIFGLTLSQLSYHGLDAAP